MSTPKLKYKETFYGTKKSDSSELFLQPVDDGLWSDRGNKFTRLPDENILIAAASNKDT